MDQTPTALKVWILDNYDPLVADLESDQLKIYKSEQEGQREIAKIMIACYQEFLDGKRTFDSIEMCSLCEADLHRDGWLIFDCGETQLSQAETDRYWKDFA
jgi:hypothetical protein